MPFKINPFTKKLDIYSSGGSGSSQFAVLSGSFDTKDSSAQELFTPAGNFVIQYVVLVATDIQGFVATFDSFLIGTNSPTYDDLDITISGFGLDTVDTFIGAIPSYSSGTPVVPSGTPIYGIISGAVSDATVFDVIVYATGFYI